MHRIDTATKAADLFGAGKDGFKDGNKASGIAATDLNAAFFNAVQEELAYLIEQAGLTLSYADNTQLRQAISKMITEGSGDYKASCRAATTANLAALSGLLTIDGVVLVAGDRVLVKDQTTGSQNGIYVAAAGAWSRSTDADDGMELNSGVIVPVESGTVNADTQWMLTSDGAITIGTTSLVFALNADRNPKNKNTIINGAFDVWQMGTSVAVAGGGGQYTADQWWFQNNGGTAAHTVSRVDGLGQSRYAARIQRNVGQAAGGTSFIEQPFTLDDFAHFRGKASKLSFRAKSGANFSPANGSLTVYLITGTGTESRRGTSVYAGEVIALNSVANLTVADTLFTFDVSALPAGCTQATLWATWTPVGVAGAADYVDIGEVQWELGSVATDFERLKLSQTRHLCNLFLEKSWLFDVAPGSSDASGTFLSPINSISSNGYGASIRYRVEKRVNPALTLYDGLMATGKASVHLAGGTVAHGRAVAIGGQVDAGQFYWAVDVAGLTAPVVCYFHWLADARL